MPFKIALPDTLPKDWKDTSSKKGIKKLKSKIVEDYDKYRANAHFMSYCEKSDKIFSSSGVCHANVKFLSEIKDAYITHNPARQRKRVKLTERFLKWFLYESQFSFFIINKDNYEFCRDYGFFFSVDTPHRLLHLANITSRHFAECSDFCFESFNYLVETKNIDPLVAYSICFLSSMSLKTANTTERETWNDYVYLPETGHRATSCYSIDSLERIIKGKTLYSLGEPLRAYFSMDGSSRLWQENQFSNISSLMVKDSAFKRKVKLYRGEKSVEIYRPPNPFKAKGSGSNIDLEKQFTHKEAIEVLAPYVQEKLEERFK